MPRLSDSMEEGTVVRWLRAVGDELAVGDDLVEIETDKATMVYEADLGGTLAEIVAAEGESLPVGAVIARIGEPAQAAPRSVAASPVARRHAQAAGLDLSALRGSGPNGRIMKRDVVGALGAGVPPSPPSPSPTPTPTSMATPPAAVATAKGDAWVEEPTRAQEVVARRMAEAKATAPHFYLTAEIDMTKAAAARAALKAAAGEGEAVPSFNDMVVKACAIALAGSPKANGSYRDGHFELHSRVNVGVAVATDGGLVVPIVHDADRKGLREIAATIRELAGRVRDGSVTPPELSGGTFTVSNLGMFGVDEFAAVINLPQAAILAVGAIREAPAVRGGEIVPARLMKVTLSCDHRILYGAEGAELLARVRALLEEPVSLAL